MSKFETPEQSAMKAAAELATELRTMSDLDLQKKFHEGIAELHGLAALRFEYSAHEAILVLMYLQLALAHRQVDPASASRAQVEGAARRLEKGIKPGPILHEILRRGWVKVKGSPEQRAEMPNPDGGDPRILRGA